MYYKSITIIVLTLSAKIYIPSKMKVSTYPRLLSNTLLVYPPPKFVAT